MSKPKIDGRSLRRKHPGTGVHDTSPFTWAAMRREYIEGTEPLTDIAQRHGVIYSAANARWGHEFWSQQRRVDLARRSGDAEELRAATQELNRASEWRKECAARNAEEKSLQRPKRRVSPCCGVRTVADRVSLNDGVLEMHCSLCRREWTWRSDGSFVPCLYVVPARVVRS